MTTPLRLIQVTGSAQWAGGERHLLDLLSGLDRARFEARVVCPEEGPLLAELAARGVPAEVVPLDPLGSLRPAAKLSELFKRWEADLVQSHGARSNFYSRLACRRTGLPHIATVHNSIFDYPVPAWRRWLYIAADRALAPSSKAIVCVSESLRRDLRRQWIGRQRLRVIYNGVDLEVFDPDKTDSSRLRAEWTMGREANPRLVGVVGRMTEQKGHRYLLEALAKLAPDIPGLKAVFVGDGPLRAELEQLAARPGLAGKVLFAGVRRDIPQVLAALDVVALPSVSEGMPYALLEALAMERPAVASAVNGVLEVAPRDGDGARLVPPRDPAALASALRSLLADPAGARAMARAGRRRVVESFSKAVMVRRWTELYESAAGARR